MLQWRHPYQVFNNRNQDVDDQSDAQHADDTMQQTSNVVIDAQDQEADDDMQGTTSAAMVDTLHRDHDLNNRSQD
jgi:hypothetical protein